VRRSHETGPHPVLERARSGPRRRAVREERGRSVEQHGVAHGPSLAAEHRADHTGIVRGVRSSQVLQARGRHAERLAGVEHVVGHLAVGDLPHVCGRRRRQFVETVLTAEDERGRSAGSEDPGHERSHPAVRDADRGGPRPGRVGQGPQEVERRRNAQVTAGGSGEAEGRVEDLGEAERDPHRRRGLGDPLGRQVEPHAERLEHVGGPARRGRGPIAVLHHGGTGARHHESGHGRDVDAAVPISAGPDDVHGLTGHVDRYGVREHRVREPREFLNRLALGPQRDEEAGKDHRARLARHHLVHGPRRPRGGQILTRDEARQEGGPGGRPGVAHARASRNWLAITSRTSSGSRGALITASASDQAASQASCGRAMRTTIRGHS